MKYTLTTRIGRYVVRVITAFFLIALSITAAVYAFKSYTKDIPFVNPVAYTVTGDTLFVVEKEKNTVLSLKFIPIQKKLILKDKFQIESQDHNYYYMLRRLYPGPDGVVARSWIYDQRTNNLLGYRFRLYRSFHEPPKDILTIFFADQKTTPDVNYAFDRQGYHYFVNNISGHFNIWKIPPAGNAHVKGGRLPAVIQEMGETNDLQSNWASILIGPEGEIYVSSVAAEKIIEYSPEGRKIRIIGSVGFEEGSLLAPMDLFFSRMEQGIPPHLTVASTGNRSWVQFDRNGKAIRTVSPLKGGYAFPDINVGQVYEFADSHAICSFDLANKSLLLHHSAFAGMTTYQDKQTGKMLLFIGLAAIFLLPLFFFQRLSHVLKIMRFPLALKQIALSVPLIVICVLLVGYQVKRVIQIDLEAESVRRSANLAQAVINSIDIADLESIEKPSDRGGPAYERVSAAVSRIVDQKVDQTPKWIVYKIRNGRYYFGINNWRGSIFEPYIVPGDRRIFFNVLLEGVPQYGRFLDDQGEWLSYLTPIRNKHRKIIYVLELYRSTAGIDRAAEAADAMIIEIGGITLLLTIVLTCLFTYLSVRPLKKLILGTQDVKKGNFDKRINVSSRDEIETLADAFNNMVSDLKTYTVDLASAAADKERLEGELEMADTIQTSIKGVIAEILGSRKVDYSFDWLIEHMEKEHFRKGDVLFRKGDQADKMYLIDKGALLLVEIEHVIGKGNLIGEMGMISPVKERTMSIVCQEDSILYSLTEEKAKNIFRDEPSLLFKLIQISIKRSLENLTTMVAEKERTEQDMKIARDIQTSVLPSVFPPFPDRKEFEIYASMDPAREIGGDFYDFFLIGEKKLCFIIADVSGKGVPAALFMMMTKILLRSVALRDLPPNEILFHVNNAISLQNDAGFFVTILCAILDTETGELNIGNAGHNPPLIYRQAKEGFEYIDLPESLVLGPLEDIKFSSLSLFLEPEESIFFYTDGVTEAMNPQSELFSEERLKMTLSSLKDQDIIGIITGVRKEIKSFVKEANQSDDITMLILKYCQFH